MKKKLTVTFFDIDNDGFVNLTSNADDKALTLMDVNGTKISIHIAELKEAIDEIEKFNGGAVTVVEPRIDMPRNIEAGAINIVMSSGGKTDEELEAEMMAGVNV